VQTTASTDATDHLDKLSVLQNSTVSERTQYIN